MELKFVTRESDFLVFESSDGTRMRAILDESLRDAIRKNQVVESSGFSPREVQSQIRLGRSVSEVASNLGVPESAVEPFALPILDELRFVLEAALNISLPDGPTMKRFEEIVLNAEPNAQFKVVKTDEGWEVSAQGSQRYTWLFNPRARVIEPTNDAARKVGRHVSVRDAIFEPSATSAPESKTEEPTASVHDLVQELRSRRQATSEIKPQTAKGRASLPSWDEIVLGTSHLDSDAD
jgi:hypothetical protein